MTEYKIRSRKALDREARISATEAAKSFGRLVDRVREGRATYIIERGGKAVAQIGPVERRAFTLRDFAALLGRLPRVDPEYLTAVEDGVARHNTPRVPDHPWAR